MTMVVKGVRMTSIYTTYIYSVRPPHGVLAGVGRVVRKLTHDASPTPAAKDIKDRSWNFAR